MWANTETGRSSARAGASTTMSIGLLWTLPCQSFVLNIDECADLLLYDLIKSKYLVIDLLAHNSKNISFYQRST